MSSILNYFKLKPGSKVTSTLKSSDDILKSLPDPDGTLSKSVPSSAIRMANDEVLKLGRNLGMASVTADTHSASGQPRPNGYLMLTSTQRCEIGKRAAAHGVTALLRYYAEKYPRLPLKETSVRRFKNLYKEAVKKKLDEVKKARAFSADDATGNPNCEVHELLRMKTGRPLLLRDELDGQVQEYIKELRSRGTAVSSSVVIAAAEGIVMNKDANILRENGGVKLTEEWAKSLLNRMGYVKRRACSKAKIDVDHFEELKRVFLMDITNIISMDEIPPQLVINFDQTAINYVPTPSWTMEKEGAKRVEMMGIDDKRQITAVFGASLSGDFLPPQLVYEGKTKRCLPSYSSPSTWNITYSTNHWSNEETMKEYIEMIILPYISKIKEDLQLPDEQGALLIFDNFKAQCTSTILTLLDSHNINVALIPANCTDRLQPLDLSINKPAKDFLRKQFEGWYAKQVCAQLDEGKQSEGVDLRLTTMKPLGAEWMVALHSHIKNNPDLVRNGFKEAGIFDCI